MIYGRQQLQANSNMIWDYVACLYPEGNLSDEYNIFFQHEEIEKVLHMGYESELDNRMQEILRKHAS